MVMTKATGQLNCNKWARWRRQPWGGVARNDAGVLFWRAGWVLALPQTHISSSVHQTSWPHIPVLSHVTTTAYINLRAYILPMSVDKMRLKHGICGSDLCIYPCLWWIIDKAGLWDLMGIFYVEWYHALLLIIGSGQIRQKPAVKSVLRVPTQVCDLSERTGLSRAWLDYLDLLYLPPT